MIISLFYFLYQLQPSWKQSEVFQLDPLTGEDAPDIPDTIKQRAVSDTLLGVVQDVLNGPELNPILSPVIGDYQVEVAQVFDVLKWCIILLIMIIVTLAQCRWHFVNVNFKIFDVGLVVCVLVNNHSP